MTNLQTTAEQARDILWAKACYIWPSLSKHQRPIMILNNRLKTTGGRAWDTKPYKIDLSTELFSEYTESYVMEIIPHEMGHIVDYAINGYRAGLKTAHNELWQGICEKLTGRVLPMCHKMINTKHEARRAKVL
jgi:predicted SprT family Zn-dependent metalloprotease